MANLLEYVGSVHIYLGPYRGNPIALYLKRSDAGCQIGPKVYPWNDVVGMGDSPNKAAADFEDKWKAKGLSADMYSGPSWEGGIKPERPAPPKPPATPKPAAQANSAPASQASAAPAASTPARVPSTPSGPDVRRIKLEVSAAWRSAWPTTVLRLSSRPLPAQDAEVCFNAFADNRLWLRP